MCSSDLDAIPGLDALPVPTDGAPSLDTLTDLLAGGLPDAPSLPGAPALPGLDAIPGLDALPIPTDGLPGLDSLTDLLGGGLPSLPGGDTGGGLPSSPVSFEDGTLTLALPEGLPISASASISGLEVPEAGLPLPA